MTPPNMAAITASIERSLQSFSLNHRGTAAGGGGKECPATHCHRTATASSDATLELNSNVALPYFWEQCLDLETGEMYYINWRTGMKSKEHPQTVDDSFINYFYSDDSDDDDEEEEKEEELSSYADDERSSVESSPAASSSEKPNRNKEVEHEYEGETKVARKGATAAVLVVAGCKRCFMYFMVPKEEEDCPKCCGQLLHFDRSHDH